MIIQSYIIRNEIERIVSFRKFEYYSRSAKRAIWHEHENLGKLEESRVWLEKEPVRGKKHHVVSFLDDKMIRADLIEIRSNKFIVINLFPLVVTAYMILDVGRIRVTFVAIRTLYTTYTAQMTYVIIEIFPPFEPLPASIAVQIVAIEIRIRIFHATNLVFLFARVPHVERQISLLGKRLAALRTLYSVRPCTGRRVFPFWKLKTQTRYVEQTFSRASIPSRLSKVKGGGGISSPFRSLCGPPLCVYVYVHVCTISLCTIHVCVYACTCTYRESEKKNIKFRRLKRRYIIYKRLFTQLHLNQDKKHQGNDG